MSGANHPTPEKLAADAGALFYTLPSELKVSEQIDTLLQVAVSAINSCGWIWTAESCQGHPDETDFLSPWGFNIEPYLRTVLRTKHLGRAVELLLDAAHDGNSFSHGPVGMRLYTRELKDGWTEFKVYAQAVNAAQRNRGCLAFERWGFAAQKVTP